MFKFILILSKKFLNTFVIKNFFFLNTEATLAIGQTWKIKVLITILPSIWNLIMMQKF